MYKNIDIRKRNDSLTLGVFLIFPALSIPLLLYMVYQKRQYALYLLAVLLAIATLKFLPVMDLYRHTMDYYSFKQMTFKDFSSELRSDFILYYFSFFCGKLGIPFECIRFVFALTSYLIFFYIYKQIVLILGIIDKRDAFRLFLCLLFVIPVIAVSLGLRFAFAAALMSMGVFEYFVQKKSTKAVMFIIMSVLGHFSMLPFALLVPLSQKLKQVSNIKLMLCISIVLLVLSAIAFTLFLDYLTGDVLSASLAGDLLSAKIGTYTDDNSTYGGLNAFDDATLLVRLRAAFPLLRLLVVFFILLSIKQNLKMKNFLIYAWFFILLLYPNISPIIRYSLFLSEAGVIYIAWHWKQLSSHKKYLLIMTLFLVCMSEIYADRNCILLERFASLFYAPLPFQFFYHDDFAFMLQNFDKEGYYTSF